MHICAARSTCSPLCVGDLRTGRNLSHSHISCKKVFCNMSAFLKRLVPTCLLVLFAFPTAALLPSINATQGPIEIDSNVPLYYDTDVTARIVTLVLQINDSALVSNATASWLAIGISEPSSGSMLGADVVTAEFSSSEIAKSQTATYHSSHSH